MTLTREQAAALNERLVPKLRYVVLLRERMDKVGFVSTDRLFQQVPDAEFAMRDLCMALHYLSCDGGVGRLPQNE
jgi:hypothetical protein